MDDLRKFFEKYPPPTKDETLSKRKFAKLFVDNEHSFNVVEEMFEKQFWMKMCKGKKYKDG